MIVSKTGDTTCTVSISKIRTYNQAMQDLDACNLVADSIYAQKQRLKSVNKDLQNEVLTDNLTISNLEKQVAEKTITEESYKKGEKRNKIKGKFLKGFATGFGIIAVFEAGWIWITTQIK
jgi:hypothetical protein